MTTVEEALAQALALHQAGDLDRAEQIYRAILQTDPGNGGAWGLLGAVHLTRGNLPEALRHLYQAVTLHPTHAGAHDNLGVALARQGRLPEAAASFREALRLKPDHAETHVNLGNVLLRQGQRAEAAASFREAVRLRPDLAMAHLRLAETLNELDRPAEAAAHFQQVLRLRPNDVLALFHLGLTLARLGSPAEAAASYEQALRLQPSAALHVNLGVVLAQLDRIDEAIAHYLEALRLQPNFAEAEVNLGGALLGQGKVAEAVEHLRRAVRLKPELSQAHNNLGNAFSQLGQDDAALACYQQALALQPQDPEILDNLGKALCNQGKVTEALAHFERAAELRRDYAEAHFHRASAWLLLGDLERGWPEYEWRWRCREFPERPLQQPRWDGSPLAGRTILLQAEQGLGDTFQFVRYAPLVQQRGGRVLLLCPAELVPILSRCPGVDQLVPKGSPLPPHDVQAPLLSLPGLLGTRLDNIPAEVPYLFADPALVARWAEELSRLPGFKVGIAWQGNPKYQFDRVRSIPLVQFEPLARLDGVRLISLQKGPGANQVSELAGRFPITELDGLDEKAGRFMDTAAVIRNLDLVITSDSAVAHLAGALGVPVWVALSSIPDWRWLLERDDSPWYPTMRLFRQRRRGDWEGVFQRIAVAQRERLATGSAERGAL